MKGFSIVIVACFLVLPPEVQAEDLASADCLQQFQQDWAFCETLGCNGFWHQLETLGSCASAQIGCELGALNRYSACSEL